MDKPLKGFVRVRERRKQVRASTKGRRLKKRISRVLETEKVAYGMEVARRINIRIHRTIKKVLDTMYREGELDRSDIEVVHKNIKVRFYWKVGTEERIVEEISELKKRLLRNHMIISTVQKRFGPKLAISSLKVLAESGSVPLRIASIIGPVRKWNGPNNEWLGDPIVKSYGDLDVLALQNNRERLWLGEVKMRGDLLKAVQCENFYASAIRFKMKIFSYRGVDFPLKLFMIAPISSVSAYQYCVEKRIELIECEKAYYPNETPRRGSLSAFYKQYKKAMGFRNLKLVSPKSLPVDNLTDLMRSTLAEDLADTI